MEELSVKRPTTALPERTESRSIVSTRWQDWKNFILTEDFWGQDSECGASTVPREF
jgi:hypothetical protein